MITKMTKITKITKMSFYRSEFARISMNSLHLTTLYNLTSAVYFQNDISVLSISIIPIYSTLYK